jgi:hypothetical protein
MQLIGKILSGTTTTITTKKGTQVAKTRLRILDQGDEAADEIMAYFVDFMGDAALTAEQYDQVLHQNVTVEIRRITCSMSNGRAFMNVTGGIILLGGNPVQDKLVDAFLHRHK